jgi:hypothetical protein
LYFFHSVSSPVYCGVKPHCDAVLTASTTLPSYALNGCSLPSIVRAPSWWNEVTSAGVAAGAGAGAGAVSAGAASAGAAAAAGAGALSVAALSWLAPHAATNRVVTASAARRRMLLEVEW